MYNIPSKQPHLLLEDEKSMLSCDLEKKEISSLYSAM